VAAELLLLRCVSVVPAALSAWALASLLVAVLRIRDPRLLRAVWVWAAIDTTLALAGRSSAGFLVLRLVLPPEYVTRGVAPYADAALGVLAAVAGALVARRIFGTVHSARAADALAVLHPASPELERAAGARVAMPPGEGAPFVAGWLRPVVVIPRQFWQGLDAAQRRAVLAHEAAHVRPHDVASRLAAGLLSDVLWFCVPLRWILARLDDAGESAADARAVRDGASAVALARAVVAAVAAAAPVPFGAVALGGRATRRIARRIDILRRPVAGRVAGLQLLAILVLGPWQAGEPLASVQAGQVSAGRGVVDVGLAWRSNSLVSPTWRGRPAP